MQPRHPTSLMLTVIALGGVAGSALPWAAGDERLPQAAAREAAGVAVASRASAQGAERQRQQRRERPPKPAQGEGTERKRESAPEPPTFARDVAPILFRSCAPCHRPGGSAPFDLLTYEAARDRAMQIRAVTASRFMPPWLPVAGHGEFAGERRLDDAQIETLRRWFRAGAPRGDAADLPPAPRWPDGWQLGPPDLVLEMGEAYPLRADGRDVYRNFVIPAPVTRTRHVKALELRPEDPRVVHHARILVDRTPGSRQLAAADPEPGFDGMDLASAENPDGYFLGWTPGKLPQASPPKMSWSLAPGSDIVLQLHLQPSGKPEAVRARLGLYFAAQPPTLHPFALGLGTRDIDIAPGHASHTVEDSYVLPVDVEALGIYPHAHYLAREMHVFADLPGGERRWLIRIDDWDFNWQDDYRYAEPVPLPKGSRISMRYTFDNTADNVRNPSHPPRRVVYGPQTTDEMAEVMLQVLPRDPGQRALLARHHERRFVLKAIAYRERRIARDPDDVASLAALGSSYLALDRPAEAIPPLERALRLLPSHTQARVNLGFALRSVGRVDEAVAQLRRALRASPRDAGVHHELGQALRQQGRRAEASGHLGEALRLRPDVPPVMIDLAWLLATHPDAAVRDAGRAVELARRASELSGEGDPVALATLAAAWAAAGRFDRATTRAREALDLAEAAGASDLAGAIRDQLALYLEQRPLRVPGPR